MTTRMPDTNGRTTTDGTVQSPLTLVMPIRSPEDSAALHATIDKLQSLPREQNPIIRALDQIATVHFARFVFLDETRLAVITTYDGDFAAYVNEFVDHIGDVFNALLEHMADAPPLPVQAHRQEFLDYVRGHDLGCVPPFYSAYPDLTVLDILAARTG
ncbi:hypothetical protein [Blastococcus deserti]|uniref:Uncharacterized protein n=1 Tax=Blastococcus deserti TaxID=2259033 RepID=A0ABW4X8T2_9ACTN